MKQGMITGANIKITAANNTLAFATNISYEVATQTIPIDVMGRYEVAANEPVGYTVSGSFSVIRYTKAVEAPKKNRIAGVRQNGSDISKVISQGGGRSAEDHLNPQNMLLSTTFDIEIHQKQNDTQSTRVFKIKNCRITRRSMSLNKQSPYMDTFQFVGIFAGDIKNNNKIDIESSDTTVDGA